MNIHLYMKKIFFIFASFLLLFVTEGCVFEKKTEETPVQKTTESVVKMGKIIPKEITIYENGTHYLVTPQGEKFLLKSSVVDLSKYEEKNVEITGTSASGEKSIEVFVVKNLDEDAKKRLSLFWEESINASISLPGTWERSEKNGIIRFAPHQLPPVIEIEKVPSGSAKENLLKKSIITGNTVLVGDQKGWSIMNDKNDNIEIIVPPTKKGGEMILFWLTPQEDVNAEKAVFYEMLMNLSWGKEQKIMTNIDTTEKCGGVAKKLCPSGFRCELTSLDAGATGICIDATLSPDEVTNILVIKQKDKENPQKSGESVHKEVRDSISEQKTEKSAKQYMVDVPMDTAKWTTYERERMHYSFALPNSWWWRSIGPSGNSLERIQIAPEEVTDENWVIAIHIRKNSDTSLDTGENLVSMVIPRNNTTDFLVFGQKQYQKVIKAIAASLSSL